MSSVGFNTFVDLPCPPTLEEVREAFEAGASGEFVFQHTRIRCGNTSNDYSIPYYTSTTQITHNSPEILSSPLVLLWIDALAAACQEIIHQWEESTLFNKARIDIHTPRPPPPTEPDLLSYEDYYTDLRSWFIELHICFNNHVTLEKESHEKWNVEQIALHRKENAESYEFRTKKIEMLSKVIGSFSLSEKQAEAMLAKFLDTSSFRIPPFTANDILTQHVLEAYAIHMEISIQGAIRVFQRLCSL